MNKTLNILLCALAVTVSTALTNIAVGVPAFPQPVVATQPDGTTFSMRLCGDEYLSWHETVDGYAIVKDKDGFWKYGRMSARVSGIEPVSNGVVGKVDPVKLRIPKHDGVPKELLRQQLQQRNAPGSALIQRAQNSSASLKVGTPEPTFAPGVPTTSSPIKIPVSGSTTVKNVVILACFSDHWDSVNSRVLPTFGRINPAEYTNLFNEVGHTNDGAVGSVRDYYNEVSYGKLTVNSVVSNWVLLPNNEAYYGANVGGKDVRPDVMAADAIAAADAAGFDFSQGDSDGDGWV
ncbi:MAG: immune inhibitor A, partial [Candidatus Sumerlaeaceae bacterium]|nr:immune inhibitor A [Candidatus Sumerlaeaceae bacterium]